MIHWNLCQLKNASNFERDTSIFSKGKQEIWILRFCKKKKSLQPAIETYLQYKNNNIYLGEQWLRTDAAKMND